MGPHRRGGHPLLGDKLYGLPEAKFLAIVEREAEGQALPPARALAELEAELGLARHALHAASLAFPHPADGRPVRFTAPWPADLAAIMAAPE